MHKTIKPCFYILITVIICLLSIFLPGIILHYITITQINVSATLSSEYYSGTTPAISKNASAQLSRYEKMELISGVWESDTTEADISESTLSEYDAIRLAQTSLDDMYENDVYPCSISSGFKNWYTWTATLYKATDNNFHTYTAYYWKLTFDRYDGSETHTVLMMEDGTILCAFTNQRSSRSDTISNYVKLNALFGKTSSIVAVNTSIEELSTYAAIDFSKEDMLIKDCSIYIVGTSDISYASQVEKAYYTEDNSNEFYYIYQLIKPNNYVYTIIPYQP